MGDLSGYISQLNSLVARKNGMAFAQLLALPVSGPISAQTRQFVERIRKTNITSYCENSYSDSNTCGIVAFRLMALVAFVDGDLEAGRLCCCLQCNFSQCNAPFRFAVITAYRHESTAYNSTLDYFSIKDDSTAWIIPVLVRVSNDLRIVATMVCSPNTIHFSSV